MSVQVSIPKTPLEWSQATWVVEQLGNAKLLNEIRQMVYQVNSTTFCKVCSEQIAPYELDVIADGLSLIHFHRFHESLLDIYALKVS